MHRKTAWFWCALVLLMPAAVLARQQILKNGSMESGQGAGAVDPFVAADWTEFGTNVERSPTVNYWPPEGGYALKAFGDADSSACGASQEVLNIVAGQSVTASVQLHTPGFDELGQSGEAGLVLEFLNMFGGTIPGGTFSVYPLTAASPPDTWIPAVLGPVNAPAGTARVRVTCRLGWSPGLINGAAYWDDAQLSADGSENLLLNGDFETAGVGTGQSPTGIDDWIGFNDQEKSDAFAEHGEFSLQLGVREAYNGLWQNMKVLDAGQHVYLQAFFLHPSTEPLTGTSRAGLKLEFDPTGQGPPPVENIPFDGSVIETWTPVEITTTVPDLATGARVVCIYLANSSTTGVVWFDSAYAEISSAPGVNQLLNASFELGSGGANGIQSWTEFNTPQVSQCQKACFVPALDGICVARGQGAAVAGIYQDVPVTTGQTITFRAFLYTPSSAPLTEGTAGVKIEWVVGSVPPDVDIGNPGSPNTQGPNAPTDVWLPLYIDFTMPAGTHALSRFTCLTAKGGATGKAYFDSCEAVLLNVFDGADSDGDDDQDLHDVARLQWSFTGAGGPLQWMGIVFDHDADEDVDFVDFNYFAPRITGPN